MDIKKEIMQKVKDFIRDIKEEFGIKNLDIVVDCSDVNEDEVKDYQRKKRIDSLISELFSDLECHYIERSRCGSSYEYYTERVYGRKKELKELLKYYIN